MDHTASLATAAHEMTDRWGRTSTTTRCRPPEIPTNPPSMEPETVRARMERARPFPIAERACVGRAKHASKLPRRSAPHHKTRGHDNFSHPFSRRHGSVASRPRRTTCSRPSPRRSSLSPRPFSPYVGNQLSCTCRLQSLFTSQPSGSTHTTSSSRAGSFWISSPDTPDSSQIAHHGGCSR